MREYDETTLKVAERVLKRSNEIVEKRKKRSAMIKKISFSVSGMCAAIITGVGIWHFSSSIPKPSNDPNHPDIITATETSAETNSTALSTAPVITSTEKSSVNTTTSTTSKKTISSNKSTESSKATSVSKETTTSSVTIVVSNDNTTNNTVVSNTATETASSAETTKITTSHIPARTTKPSDITTPTTTSSITKVVSNDNTTNSTIISNTVTETASSAETTKTTKPPETTTPTIIITTKEVQEGAFTAVINVRAADTGETLRNVDVAFVEYDADLMVNPDAKIIRTIAEWNTSDNDSYTIEDIPFVQGHFYYVKIDSVPEGYSFNSRSSYLNGIHGDGILSGVQSYNVTVSKTPTLDSLVKFPESGSYPAKFTIIDEESKEVVKGLDIELYTLDSYSVDANLIDKLAEWNTTDSETYSCNLPYSFENQDSYSAYGVVIKNMPEGYVYTFSGENSNCFPVDYRPMTIWTDAVSGNTTHEHEYTILIEEKKNV